MRWCDCAVMVRVIGPTGGRCKWSNQPGASVYIRSCECSPYSRQSVLNVVDLYVTGCKWLKTADDTGVVWSFVVVEHKIQPPRPPEVCTLDAAYKPSLHLWNRTLRQINKQPRYAFRKSRRMYPLLRLFRTIFDILTLNVQRESGRLVRIFHKSHFNLIII